MAQTEDLVTAGAARTTTDLETGNGRTSEDIRSDIERTRSEMDETFAALDVKLTPREMALEAWHLVKGGSAAGASRLWSMARQHPMPTALIGLGVGWLLVAASRGDGRAEDYGAYRAGYAGELGEEDYGFETEEPGGRLSAVKAKVKGAAGSARERMGEAAGWTKGRARGLGDRAGALRHRAKDRASLLGQQAQEQAHRARTGFWHTLEENPLMVGAATFALGLVAGLAIPSTEREDELMGARRDRLVEEAKEAGQQTLEKGRHVADAVAGTVKEQARSQGLTPEGMVEKAKAVAREAAHTAKEEARRQNLTAEAAANRARQAAEHVRETARSETHPVEEPELAKR